MHAVLDVCDANLGVGASRPLNQQAAHEAAFSLEPAVPANTGIDPVEFGRLQAEVQALRGLVDELRQDMKRLLADVESARGGWKTLLMLGGVSATLGGLVAKALVFFQASPLK